MSRRGAILVFVSVLGHSLFLGLGAPRQRPFIALAAHDVTTPVVNVAHPFVRKTLAQEARRTLVQKARVDRARNRLQLGKFLLEANRIDAEEAGHIFDMGNAASRYEERVADLRRELRDDDRLLAAVPVVFGDLRYYGQPGEWMVDALLEGGGNCQQISHLIVAAIHDVGRENDALLRFYGKPMADGVTHLAAIGVEKGVEHDLLTGKPALLKGARFAADELVEVYARAHDLAPPLEKPGGGGNSGGEQAEEDPQKTSFAAGFPPNDDRFPGSLPLYSAQAVRASNDGQTEALDPSYLLEEARNCAYSVRMAALSPPLLDIERPGLAAQEPLSVEAVRTPNLQKIEREADLLRGAETLSKDPHADLADRLMSYACLASLGEIAAVDFSLVGERRLAKTALEARARGKEEGKKALAAIAWTTDEGGKTARRLSVDYAGRAWLLLFLEGGSEVVLHLNAAASADDWGRISSMAALVLFPETRGAALLALQQWSLRDQVDVMHEVFHAHDHLRPWATNYELEAPRYSDPTTEIFVRAYRVFRGLAFRLWEGQRDVQESLTAFQREAETAKLPPAWQAAMLDYFSRNTLGLFAQRPNGFSVVPVLAAEVRRSAETSLDPLRRQLGYLQAEGRLDARTLADAFRLR